MILHDAGINGQHGLQHIHIQDGKIKTITGNRAQLETVNNATHWELEGASVFPGFINSHDHLDFNLFPRLGNRVYNNYTEWGKDIHIVNSAIIKEVLAIPRALRVKWGLYKNLLNGFTTVVNHGEQLAVNDDLITVFQDCYPLHSPAFEKHWKWKLNNPLKTKRSFVMHIGEGTDAAAGEEIDKVIRGNIFRKKIIAIHGVAMKQQQAAAFQGLVWCPASNYFLLGKTAGIDELKQKTRIVFGTDSTLTASWNAWDHFRQAKQSNITTGELIAMLSTTAAMLWDMADEGTLAENKHANIVVTKKIDPGTDQFFALNPRDILLVIHKGQVRLADETVISKENEDIQKSFSRIVLDGSVKFVQGDLPLLAKEIKSYYPRAEFPFSW